MGEVLAGQNPLSPSCSCAARRESLNGRSNSRPRTECFHTNVRQLAGRQALLTCGTPPPCTAPHVLSGYSTSPEGSWRRSQDADLQRIQGGLPAAGATGLPCRSTLSAYSGESVHEFRRKPSGGSGASRPPVPVHSVHPSERIDAGVFRTRRRRRSDSSSAAWKLLSE